MDELKEVKELEVVELGEAKEETKGSPTGPNPEALPPPNHRKP